MPLCRRFLGSDLLRFDSSGGVLQHTARQVLEECPKNLRASEGPTVNDSLHLVPEALQECGVARQIWLDMGGHGYPSQRSPPRATACGIIAPNKFFPSCA